MSKRRVLISACLLGEQCRYDGKTKKINAVVDAYKEYEIIPFCPEAPLFGTPRERISVVEIENEQRIIKDVSGKDVTQKLANEIELFCKTHPSVDAIVLKSKSPSCGYKTTPIVDAKGNVLGLGDGIAIKIFQKNYKNIEIQNENNF